MNYTDLIAHKAEQYGNWAVDVVAWTKPRTYNKAHAYLSETSNKLDALRDLAQDMANADLKAAIDEQIKRVSMARMKLDSMEGK